MASANEILSGGRADIGGVQSGAPVTNERSVELGNQFINSLSENLNFKQMEQNKTLFDQKVKDRDAMLALFASGQTKLGAVDPKHRDDFEKASKEATDLFNKIQGANDLKGQEKYYEAINKKNEIATLAQLKTALKAADTQAAQQETSPTLKAARLKAIDANYSKGLYEEWTLFVPNVQINLSKELESLQPSNMGGGEQGIKTETVTQQAGKPVKDVIQTKAGVGVSRGTSASGQSVKNTKDYMQTTTGQGAGGTQPSGGGKTSGTESKYITMEGLKDEKGNPIKVAYDTKTTSENVYDVNEVIKKANLNFVHDDDAKWKQQQVVGQLLKVTDPSEIQQLKDHVDYINTRLRDAQNQTGAKDLEFEFEDDGNGNFLKDKDGNFIPVVKGTKPTIDENGNKVYPQAKILNTPALMARIAIASHNGDYKTSTTTETVDKDLLEKAAKVKQDEEKLAQEWTKINKVEIPKAKAEIAKWQSETQGKEETKNAALNYATTIYGQIEKLANSNGGIITPDMIRTMTSEQLKYLGKYDDVTTKVNGVETSRKGLVPLTINDNDIIVVQDGVIKVMKNAHKGKDKNGNDDWGGEWDETRSTSLQNIATNRVNEENQMSGGKETNNYVPTDLKWSEKPASVVASKETSSSSKKGFEKIEGYDIPTGGKVVRSKTSGKIIGYELNGDKYKF